MLGYWICGFALQMGGVGAIGRARRRRHVLNHEFTVTSFGKRSACSA